jgi:hypothetical protein
MWPRFAYGIFVEKAFKDADLEFKKGTSCSEDMLWGRMNVA